MAGDHRQVGAGTPAFFCASSGGGSASVIDWFPRVHFPGARKKPLGTKQRGEPALKWRCLTEQREKFAITTTVSIFGVAIPPKSWRNVLEVENAAELASRPCRSISFPRCCCSLLMMIIATSVASYMCRAEGCANHISPCRQKKFQFNRGCSMIK